MRCTMNRWNEVGDCLTIKLCRLLILLLSIALYSSLDKLRLKRTHIRTYMMLSDSTCEM